MPNLKRDQLLRLAKLGAAKRLEELQDEVRAIHSLIGGRVTFGRRRGRPPGGRKRAGGRRRRGWTAAQRKEAADRMRAYWAKRRGERKK